MHYQWETENEKVNPMARQVSRPKPIADLVDLCLGPSFMVRGFAESSIIFSSDGVSPPSEWNPAIPRARRLLAAELLP